MAASIQALTEALRVLLQNGLQQVVPGAKVTLKPPGDLRSGPALNLYLYLVTDTAGNAPQQGSARVLSYVLTPVGDDDTPVTILDAALTTLGANPVLNVGGSPVNISSRNLSIEELSRIVVPYRLSVAFDARVTKEGGQVYSRESDSRLQT
jgi:hypothetical protein